MLGESAKLSLLVTQKQPDFRESEKYAETQILCLFADYSVELTQNRSENATLVQETQSK